MTCFNVYDSCFDPCVYCCLLACDQSPDPDLHESDETSIAAESELSVGAYMAVLSDLVRTAAALPILHVNPQLVHLWAVAADTGEAIQGWLTAHSAVLSDVKYIIFHHCDKHFCALMLNVDVWKAGPIQHAKGASPAASSQSTAAATATRSMTGRRAAASTYTVAEHSRVDQEVPWIHMDTLVSSCHFLKDHSALLRHLCEGLNKHYHTTWPGKESDVSSTVHLAGPPSQLNDWSCGYHLLYAWCLLFKRLHSNHTAAPSAATPVHEAPCSDQSIFLKQ